MTCDAIAIEGGHLVDPVAGVDAPRDLLLRDGKVFAVDKPGAFRSADVARRIDARGCWVVPGLIDLHCHLREPGYEYKETVASGRGPTSFPHSTSTRASSGSIARRSPRQSPTW